ncbi:MAG: hypothetical protein AB7S75_04780 [Desulfococcaceae bacterium]
MKLMNEFKLLVIVGAWNRNIFSGEWIKKFLLPKDDFFLEVALDNSHRISSEKIRVEFHNNRINFIPIINDIENYKYISDLSLKIADYLPHTPVFGYGINFIFECDSKKIQTNLIKINDIDKLNECGIIVINSQYKHSVKFDNIPINIAITAINDNLNFDFNFHSDIRNLTQFKESIYEFPVERLYSIALEIMKNVYMLQLEGE